MIIDAHLHLWDKQHGMVNGKPVYDIGGGRSDFGGDLIRQKYPEAKIVFVARSEESSPKVAFALKQAKADYVKNDFDTNA